MVNKKYIYKGCYPSYSWRRYQNSSYRHPDFRSANDNPTSIPERQDYQEDHFDPTLFLFEPFFEGTHIHTTPGRTCISSECESRLIDLFIHWRRRSLSYFSLTPLDVQHLFNQAIRLGRISPIRIRAHRCPAHTHLPIQTTNRDTWRQLSACTIQISSFYTNN